MKALAVLKKLNGLATRAFSLALFAVLYALVFFPVAGAMRLAGKRFLPRFTGEESSYYTRRDPLPATLAWMRRPW